MSAMSSSFIARESSRAGEQPQRDEVVVFHPRPWVALSFIPVVLGANDKRAWMLAPDARARTVVRLPAVPAHLGVRVIRRHSIGLIADPRHGGHYMVAQLQPPTLTTLHKTLLCYSTVTDQWTTRPLASAEEHYRWGAHGGLLWWIDVSCGMLICDPFAADDNLHLRFIPLPVGCMVIRGPVRRPELMAKQRFIRPSQGKLRYVEIRTGVPIGPNRLKQPPEVRMFTLVSQEGQHYWVHEYTATFADIWSHHSYADAGLPWGVVPSLALIDPNNPNTLYFFQGTTLFAVDGKARKVLFHLQYLVDSANADLNFQNSGFVSAWELPQALFVNRHARAGLP
ncbi:Putative DUF1618 domain containing family protein [Zea mays]|uniref:Putative DUF1618 domain containing family protein n=1 Tax=Zea mays TaxID=4577 RepID=A0A1D6QD82_MAIZE|nr:Putative DUF1618 domain containing family protein [Zea mays]